MTDVLATILGSAKGLLIDFDGPICAVFAGFASSQAAAELRLAAQTSGIALPPHVTASTDPVGILRATHEQNAVAGAALEPHVTAIELDAMETATPTPGATALLRCRILKAVVSNNSTKAVTAYLERKSLIGTVDAIFGRPPGQPEAMKPEPRLVTDALNALGLHPDHCVLIGDSTTDVQAALSAGVATIGFANKPGKASRLLDAGAAAVVTDLYALLPLLRSISARSAPESADSPNQTPGHGVVKPA